MGGFPDARIRIACGNRGLEFFPVTGHIEIPLIQNELIGATDRLVRDENARVTLGAGNRMEQADHSFHVPTRSGRTDAQVMGELVERLAAWIATVIA